MATEDLLTAVAARIEPLTAAISASNPAGEDPAYDPSFEAIKAEVDKLTGLEGATPAWPEVAQRATELLRTKAKDLRVATWLAVAQLETSGLGGLLEGLALTRALAQQFWDGMYPSLQRKRARPNALEWLSEQLAQQLAPMPLTFADHEVLCALESLSTELDGLFHERMGELYTGMGQLLSTLRDKVRTTTRPAEAPKATPSSAATPAAAAASNTSGGAALPGSPALDNPGDVKRALVALSGSVVETARVLRVSDPSHAWAYRLQRAGMWLPVEKLPPVEGGGTLLPPPPEEERSRLEKLRAGGNARELLAAAEGLTSQYLFWLDPHRHVVQAMGQLGANFAEARDAITREVLAFVARLPGVASLKFRDGTPFADVGTKSWLEEEQGKDGQQAGAAAALAVDEEDRAMAERLEAARRMVREGKASDGLSLAVELSWRGPDARSRFKAQLEVAQLCLVAGQPLLGKNLLEGLAAEAARRDVESWEPKLCASLYALQLKCLGFGGKKPEGTGPEAELFARLSRLDPKTALQLLGS